MTLLPDDFEVLVWLDEPQLMVSKRDRVMAMAVPTDDSESAVMLAWDYDQNSYDQWTKGGVDLLHLVSVAAHHWTFDLLRDLRGGRYELHPVDYRVVPDEWRPGRDFQYSSTTGEDHADQVP